MSGLRLAILLLSLLSNASLADSKTFRMEEVLKQHPYVLLGDDFGILNSDDLAMAAEIAQPIPFSEKSKAYPYWQCFDSKSISIVCESTGYYPSEKVYFSILAVVIRGKSENQEYLSRRAIPHSSCIEFKRDWKHLSAGQQHACISGPFSGRGTNDSGKATRYWVFDKFKTRKGCESYFKGACEGDRS